MAVCKLVIFNQYVLAGHVGHPAVPVPAGFQADTVVSCVEPAIADMYAIAALRVAAVIVGAVTVQCDAVHGQTPAHHRVQLPHRTVYQGKPLKKHTAAADGLYEIRPQVMARSKDPLFNRHSVHIHTAQGPAVFQLKVRLII